MMPKWTLLIWLGIIPNITLAQLIQTKYYNLEWMKALESSYDYKREIYQTEAGYQIKDFNDKGKIQMIGHYASIDTLVENGHFQFFNRKGIMTAEGEYTIGVMSGIWKHFDKKGKFNFEIDFDYNDIKCEISSDDKEVQSSQNQEFIIVEEMPSFQEQGFQRFRTYITMNVVYPPMAFREYGSGTVLVTFIIDREGYVCNVVAEGDVHKDLLAEAKRVVLTSPRWKPGKQKGEPVRVQFTFPIHFFLQ